MPAFLKWKYAKYRVAVLKTACRRRDTPRRKGGFYLIDLIDFSRWIGNGIRLISLRDRVRLSRFPFFVYLWNASELERVQWPSFSPVSRAAPSRRGERPRVPHFRISRHSCQLDFSCSRRVSAHFLTNLGGSERRPRASAYHEVYGNSCLSLSLPQLRRRRNLDDDSKFPCKQKEALGNKTLAATTFVICAVIRRSQLGVRYIERILAEAAGLELTWFGLKVFGRIPPPFARAIGSATVVRRTKFRVVATLWRNRIESASHEFRAGWWWGRRTSHRRTLTPHHSHFSPSNSSQANSVTQMYWPIVAGCWGSCFAKSCWCRLPRTCLQPLCADLVFSLDLLSGAFRLKTTSSQTSDLPEDQLSGP